jgi:hypothetical protein
LEHEIIRKAPPIALHGLVEAKGWNAVQSREISVQNDFLIPDRDDHIADGMSFNCLISPGSHNRSKESSWLVTLR